MYKFQRLRSFSPIIAALLGCTLLATAACGAAPSAVATKTPRANQATATPSVAAMEQLAAEWRAGKFQVDPATVIYSEDPATGRKNNGIFVTSFTNSPIPKGQVEGGQGVDTVQLPIIGIDQLVEGDYVLLAALPNGHVEQIDIGNDSLRGIYYGPNPSAAPLSPLYIATMPGGYFDATRGSTNELATSRRDAFVDSFQRWLATHLGQAADVCLLLYFHEENVQSSTAQLLNGSLGARERFYLYVASEGSPPASLDNTSLSVSPSSIPVVVQIAITSAFGASLGYS